MPYRNIHGHQVFLPNSLYLDITKEVFEDKPAEYRVLSTIAGTEASKENDTLIINWLENKYKDDPNGFHERFVKFDIFGENAKIDVFNLLCDWCHYTRLGQLADKRESIDKVLAEYAGDSWAYPMGQSFNLVINVSGYRNLLKKISASQKYISIEIDTRKIIKLKGTLDDFQIYMGQIILTFNKSGVNIKLLSNRSS